MKNFTQIPNEICREKNLTPNEKAILIFIRSFNPSWPSYDDIKEGTGLSRKTVGILLKELKKQNIITWSSGRTGLNNTYSMLPIDQWKLVPLNLKNKKNGQKRPRKGISTRHQSTTPIIASNNTNRIRLEDSISSTSTRLLSSSSIAENETTENCSPSFDELGALGLSQILNQVENIIQSLGAHKSDAEDAIFSLLNENRHIKIPFEKIEELLLSDNCNFKVIEKYRAELSKIGALQ